MDGAVLPAAGAPLHLRIPPDAKFGRYVRERVADFATANAIPEDTADEFITAIGEALANAIEHGCCTDDIEIACRITSDQVLLASVVDRGIGFDPGTRPVPAFDPLTERGRGLPIMRQYTDHMKVESEPGRGTSVTLARNVRCFTQSDREHAAP
jgi:stage II sporulation protein AB (anti-sigma F factor)